MADKNEIERLRRTLWSLETLIGRDRDVLRLGTHSKESRKELEQRIRSEGREAQDYRDLLRKWQSETLNTSDRTSASLGPAR